MKRCTKCGVEKSLDNFPPDKRAKDGKQTRCYVCFRQYHHDNKSKRNQYSREYNKRNNKIVTENRSEYYKTVKGRASVLFTSAKLRAKQFNREITITKDYVETILSFGNCWVSGIPFSYVKTLTKHNPFAPSIDRKRNTEGYTHNNVQIVCNMVNMAKSDADEIDFIAMCIAVAEMNKNNQAAIARLAELKNAGH